MNAQAQRHLVVGANGMLGRAWRKLLDATGAPYASASSAQLDITDHAQVERFIDGAFHTVINCAAYTDVDGAENDERAAMRLNADAVEHLAGQCARIGATLVHYSTDYVFNGHASAPYPVDAPREPINAYGRTKAEGERRIEQSGCAHLLIRTSWLYAPWGRNFVRTMAELTRAKDQLRVVDDQRGRPTSATHLAHASLELLQRRARGVFHVTDGGECTWYELTREINRQLGHHCRIEPCTTAEFPRPAKRPAYSVLEVSKAEELIGPMPAWQGNLRAVLAQCEPQETRS